MIERIEVGERMSEIVKHNGVVYLCGQIGSGTSMQAQTTDMLRRVDELLIQANSSKENILQATIWVADMKYFAEMNEVWDAWVPKGSAPTRACCEAKLARPDWLVEIIIVAAELTD